MSFTEKYGDVKSPFENDPFVMICKAFCRLYPDKKVDAMEYADLGGDGYGCTDFCDDGSINIYIDTHITAENAAEVLAHELAHVAAGQEHGHDPKWEDAFDAIFTEYGKMCDNYQEQREDK